jgi:amino acid adenylation domain-containing protein
MLDNSVDGTLRTAKHHAHITDTEQPVHDLIALSAIKSPDSVAVKCDGVSLTYAELETRSNQLARRLQADGVALGDLVGICIERSVEMLVGLLGTLKAGGTYVPIDPAYPADRVAYMLEDSGAKYVLTQGALKSGLAQVGANLLALDDDWASIAAESGDAFDSPVGPNDSAYVIYTSGSTGRPKGVEIPHRALSNFLISMRDEPGLGEDDRLLAVTTLSFDIAGLELYLPLVVGAQVIIASRDMAADGGQLARAIDAEKITVMQATPATWRLLLESEWQGNPLMRILCGGEALPRELAERLVPCCAELWNMYGPTETTIWSTIRRIESGSGPISIGHPIANTTIEILDDDLKPVADGESGELFIGGDGLAVGYFQREEMTAERFIPHPQRPDSGERLYRTGDLVRLQADGSLEHLGRVDFQVKVRGFRIELGEIEAILDSQDSIRQSVVLAREDVPGEKRLVAYFVPAAGDPPTSKALRAALAAKLPDYMVPGLYQSLDAFPLTPNGKVDRNALPAPDLQRPELADDYLAPRNEDEIRLANIWGEVLRVDQVGVNDNFFELGGDSLKVAQVATRIRAEFGKDILLRSVFEHPTVAGLMPVIAESDRALVELNELDIMSVKRGEEIPLSFAQERVWFTHQLNPQNLAYNFQSSIEFKGTLDIAALERSLGEVLRRHESYRTTFPTVDGKPVQIVHPYTEFTLPIVDFSVKGSRDRAMAAYEEWCAEDFQRRFDLSKLPLVRWTLLKITDDESILMHVEHHTVHDGWSFNMFFIEVVELYRAFAAGKPSPLPEIPLQFAEFATWQHEWMEGPVSDRQLAYWKEKLSTIPPLLEMPTKGPRPAVQTFRGTTLRPEVPIPLCNQLRALSRAEGSTLFMTMLAGFMALLHRYTSETDVAVGTFFANRRAKESEHLIGMILNNTVIRATLENNPTVRELMVQVRNLVLEAADNQDVPFDRVVDAVQPQRDLSMNPLFQVMFSFHDEPMPETVLDGLNVELTPVLSNGSSKFDLGVIGIPHSAQNLGLPQGSDQDGLTMIWEHNTDLFETETIAHMFEHYRTLLSDMVANPDQRISDLSIIEQAERDQVLVEWNDTAAAFPATDCVQGMFAAQAAATPDAVAVVYGSQELTYRDLDEQSNQLAAYLSGQGVDPGTLVGICVDRSEKMLVGLLGILKTGAAYVPIDPNFPVDRQIFMIEDAKIGHLVTEKDLDKTLPTDQLTLIKLDADAAAISAMPKTPPADPGTDPEDIAYVIFTSGSTGRPKGVQIPHRALANFLHTMRQRPGLSPEDRLFAVTTLSFDIAGLELYLPLVVGARTIICPRSVAINGQELMASLASTGATIMQATPTTWQMLIDTGWKGDASFRALCGGEALPRNLAEELLPRVSALWNMYGPTETTIWSTIERVESATGSVPIGRPIDNTQIYILDAYDNAVPAGVIGELCIGGRGTALGYLNRPELTAERFIENPIPGCDGIIYRTGDLARIRRDGTLECLGRTDHQVKLRGFRIELGEIETQLDQLDTVAQAVAIVREDVAGDARLVAYIVPAGTGEPSSVDLQAALGETLPDYMVPSIFVFLEEMPLTPNGKVDRKALPKPASDRRDAETRYVAPRNDFETQMQTIWQDVLGVSSLGVQDDFFAAGGHSLLAVRLVSQIEVKTGKRLELAALLQGRTIEAVARLLVDDTPAQSAVGIDPIQTTGSRTPFFAGGSSPKYVDIAHEVGTDQPFYRLDLYGLQSHRLAQGMTPFRRIEEYASYFLGEIRKIQPEGPYNIGGGCEGAYVAFEMALQLQRQSERAERVVMWIPPPLRATDGFSWRRLAPVVVANQLRYFLGGGALKNANMATLRVLFKHEYIEYTIMRALMNYDPQGKYEGRGVIVRTEESPIQTSADLNQPWIDRCTEGADIHVVPGNHESWFERHRADFVKVLRSSLGIG